MARAWSGIGWLATAAAGAAAVTVLVQGDTTPGGTRASPSQAQPAAPVQPALPPGPPPPRRPFKELADVMVDDLLRAELTLPLPAAQRFAQLAMEWPDRFVAGPSRSGY